MRAGLRVGDVLPELVRRPTTRTLVKYAGASGDFNEQHYDLPFAQRSGFTNVMMHGLLQTAYLGELIMSCVRDGDRLVSFDTRYLGIAYPGEPYYCRGRVTAATDDTLELEVWGEDGNGRHCARAVAVIAHEQAGRP